jgi:hypothetical protein
LMEIAGEDGFCYFLREADIEAVDAAAISEVDHPEKLAPGMDFDHALPAAGSEELFDQPQGLEDLQGAGVNDGCSIPVERRRLRFDHVAGHSSAVELGGEEQSGWAGSDYQDGGLACVSTHRRKSGSGSQQFCSGLIHTIGPRLGVVNLITFSRRKCSAMLVGDLTGWFRQG